MFRQAILSVCTSLLAASALAQDAKKYTPSYHISLGPIVAFGGSRVSSTEHNQGFKASSAAGIRLIYSRSAHWSFGAQFLISHEGYRKEVAGAGGKMAEVTINPVYFRFPGQVIYYFCKHSDHVKPKIYAGPSFGLRMDETHRYSDAGMRPAEGTPAASDVFRLFDAGVNAGVGANVLLGKAAWLNLDASYYYGLADVIATQNNVAFNRNRNLRLNVGIIWGL